MKKNKKSVLVHIYTNTDLTKYICSFLIITEYAFSHISKSSLNLCRLCYLNIAAEREHFEELNAITYESCLGDMENLTYLLNFAPEKELDIFHARAVSAMQTRVLIDLIDKAVITIKDYPDNGKTYYSIIDLKYIGYFQFTEDEILEQLNLERSTYYRKKKEATMLLGYVLFGRIMPEYIRTEKVANYCY